MYASSQLVYTNQQGIEKPPGVLRVPPTSEGLRVRIADEFVDDIEHGGKVEGNGSSLRNDGRVPSGPYDGFGPQIVVEPSSESMPALPIQPGSRSAPPLPMLQPPITATLSSLDHKSVIQATVEMDGGVYAGEDQPQCAVLG